MLRPTVTAHRWITIEVLVAAVRFLTREIDHALPARDLRVSTRQMPTAPSSGLVMADVRATAPR